MRQHRTVLPSPWGVAMRSADSWPASAVAVTVVAIAVGGVAMRDGLPDVAGVSRLTGPEFTVDGPRACGRIANVAVGMGGRLCLRGGRP